MKDSILLFVTALVVAAIAWTFWHFSGTDGFFVLNIIALLVVAADNFRLRRQLKRRH